MTVDPTTLLYGVYASVFLAVGLGAQGALMVGVERRGRRDAIRRRMHMAEQAGVHEDRHEALRRRPDDPSEGIAAPNGIADRLERLARQGGLAISGPRIAIVMGAVWMATILITAVGVPGLDAIGRASPAPGDLVAIGAAFIAATVLGVGAPLAYLRHRRSRRLARIARQLPEALDIMVRSLRAGHPVTAAMAMVSRDLTGPLAAEFRLVVDEMTYGLDLRQALANLGRRVDLHDLRYVVVSVNLQHETGGNLAELLEGLATVIRARFRLARKIRSLSAEARLSAKILVAMPFVFGGLVLVANPGLYLEAARDPLFLPVLAMTAALEVLGIAVMQRLIRLSV